METLYEYLLKNYKLNEPIFLAALQIEGMSRASLRLSEMEPYFSYYPDKLYKNLVETRVIYNGILAQ